MDGYKNEFDFVLALNNKTKKELNPLLQDLVYYLFGNIDDDEVIKSWRNHEKQKTDVFIKANGLMKGISIKMGNKNSVHTESIKSFVMFLKEIGLDEDVIKIYLKYHYGDETLNGTGKRKMDVEEVKEKYEYAIKLFNNIIKDEEIVKKAINRFILQGTNSRFKIDAIVSGTPNDFIWLSKDNIINILLKHREDYSSSIHFSNLIIQPLSRCLNDNKEYESYRDIVQVKWYKLGDNIIEYMNDYKIRKLNCRIN